MKIVQPYLLWLSLLPIVLFLLDTASIRLFAPAHKLDVGGWGDQVVVDGVFAQESDALGKTYRWTDGAGEIRFDDVTAGRPALLTLAVGGIPPNAQAPLPVEVSINSGHALTVPVQREARRYRLLLPAPDLRSSTVSIQLDSATTQTPPDRRLLGLRLDEVAISWRQPWVPVNPLFVVVQVLVVLICAILLRRIGVAERSLVGISLGLAVLMAALTGRFLVFAWSWHLRLLVILLLLLVLFWRLPELLPRYFPRLRDRLALKQLLLLALLAMALPLIGVTYPPFASHDQSIHTQRLAQVISGQTLLIDRPSEFQGRESLTPITFYLFAVPWTLLVGDHALVLHSLYTIVQGLSGFLVALLMLSIGSSLRAALMALVVMAGLSVQLTILWWGFGPQIVGQWVLLLLALVALQPGSLSRRGWIGATLTFALAIMMHNGNLLLGGAWLAIYSAILCAREGLHSPYWRKWLAVLLIGGGIALICVYLNVLYLNLSVEAPLEMDSLSSRIRRIITGLVFAVKPINLALALLSLAVLIRHAQHRQRYLLVAWILSASMFLLLDVVTGQQVRYGYFVVPLVAMGLPLLIDWGLKHYPRLQPLGWALILLLYYQGASLWYAAAILGSKPSVNGLTH